ncbi:hypothetical protein [Salinibacterium sp. SWN167]|uniref:hypothetical protein n=1 Tax=Salinibacterium sp. SWN167 TaxID=2792054 RepID=UPI0018CD7008|nr:hypothetical protein [Salinibacterium sp. SWN167]MBH0082841.1 hypothetical protein [Salinibacterium sp. SWN167]
MAECHVPGHRYGLARSAECDFQHYDSFGNRSIEDRLTLFHDDATVAEFANSLGVLPDDGQNATALVHDPLYGDDELAGLGFTPHYLGEAVDTAVVQPEHAEYRGLTPADLPGIKNSADGRCVNSVEQWPGATYRVTGNS